MVTLTVKKILWYSNSRSPPKNIIDFCKTYMVYDAVTIVDEDSIVHEPYTIVLNTTCTIITWTQI